MRATEKAGLTFHHRQLGSGLTVIGEHNPEAQSFAAGYFVNTGARDEAPELAGVSHFLEHMLFKGTARRSADDINREFDELGANYNAYTDEERTVYYGAVLPERGAALLDLLTDMMRPALRQEDFDVEKQVILEEIAMYEDRPSFRVFELGNARFYNGHPLGQSILGSRASVQALSQAQMEAYFGARYAPNNMLLALSGAYDWPKVLAQLEQLSSTWQPQETRRSYPALRPRQGRDTEHDPGLARAHVALYAPGVSAQDERRYAAALLASCLGDSSGSRLYWSLIDKGLADNASLSHDSGDGTGAFVGYLSTTGEQLEAVLEVYLATLRDFEDGGPSTEEWQRAQRKLATALTLRSETPFGRLMSFGSSYLYTGSYESLQDVVDNIFATSRAQAAELLGQRPLSAPFVMVLRP